MYKEAAGCIAFAFFINCAFAAFAYYGSTCTSETGKSGDFQTEETRIEWKDFYAL